MKKRRFGKTGLDLSVFSLGTMRCLASAEIAQQVLGTAIQQGINHIETARGYGQSERYIGAALRNGVGCEREQLVVTTKITPNTRQVDKETRGNPTSQSGISEIRPWEDEPSRVERQIDESLERLGLDYIDCLAIHGINTPDHLDQVTGVMLPGIQAVLADGRVRHVGFSTHGPLDVILDAIATDIFEFINLHYSYFFQRNAPAIELASQKDLGIFIISPADKGGMLYTPSEQLKTDCAPFDPLLLTYRWLLSDARITTLSVGPAVPQELDWPLQVSEQTGPLHQAERDVFQKLAQTQTSRLGTDKCSQCYACLPCPEAINIPEVLRLRNLAVAHDMTQYGQYRYRMFENAGHWFPGRKGARCTDCGDCLPRCPETLDIPTLLRDSHERLNGAKRRRLWE